MERSAALYEAARRSSHVRIDRLFALLMPLQWFAAVGLALWVTPLTWAGSESAVHAHVWAAVLLGGALALFPTLLAIRAPGRVETRLSIGVGQVLMSGLLIHLTGGRIETHFHIFGSLAFLAFYRDLRVLHTTAAVVVVDHLLRGELWPRSVYGVSLASPWRSVEHAGWVLFELAFLRSAIQRSNQESLESCRAHAELEDLHAQLGAVADGRANALAASESRFHEFCECSPVGIFVTDAQGQCTYVNRKWCEMSGLSPLESLGSGWLRALHPDDAAAHQAAWDAAGASGSEFSAIGRIGSPDSSRWIHSRARVVRDTSGNVRSWVGTVEDVTAQREYEESLRVAHAKALEASRAKSEFLASMSHEIRTPMNGVIGMTGLLLGTPLSQEQREYAEVVRRSGETLLALINDILDFSKIEAGRLDIEPVPFDLLMAVEECVEAQALVAEKRGVELVLSFDPAAPRRVVGDCGRIRQILTNLLSNALKFTHEGRVVLSVRATPVPAGGHRYVFDVEDTGIGIAPEKVEAVFERFTQADGSTTRHYGGTGLGLAICRQLANLMGGGVTARSTLGVGSCFTLTLELPAAPGTASPAPVRTALIGKRALAVDDDEVNRRVLREQLVAAGMEVHTCASGAEALELLTRPGAVSYDVAVLDHQMPGMDGAMLARRVRDARLAPPPVLVMLTSLGRLSETALMREGGFAVWLTKPVRVSELLNTLARVLARPEPAAPTVAVAEPLPVPPPPAVRSHRVLVVEDNAVNQVVATRLLQQLGCRVDVAANGREALEMLSLLPYELVFMDCQMPELDGYEATRLLRESPAPLGLIPVIGLTAHALAGDRERCLEAGMDDFLTKPILRDGLGSALDRWISPAFDAARGAVAGEEAALAKSFPATADAAVARLLSAHAAGDERQVVHVAGELELAAERVGAAGVSRAARALQSIAGRSPLEAKILVRTLRREVVRVSLA